MTAATLPLKFQIGARTLASVPRRLIRVPLSLDDALAGRVPMLPALGPDDHGFLVTSLPEDQLGGLDRTDLVVAVRQRYRRYWVDLDAGEAAWFAGLSANTRSALKRKRRRLAAEPGFAITRYRTPDEIAAFHADARVVSARTYQEALLVSGLPIDPAPLLALAAADRVRAWLLTVGDTPVAYLACTADGDTLRYDHVGHDPALGALSPGTVLQAEALGDLFAEGRFARFDFTEGEGQHKRGLATGSVACVDVLLLRASIATRLTLAALAGFDGAMAVAKRLATRPTLKRLAKKVRR